MITHSVAVLHVREWLVMVGLSVVALLLFTSILLTLTMNVVVAKFKDLKRDMSPFRTNLPFVWAAYAGMVAAGLNIYEIMRPIALLHARAQVTPVPLLFTLFVFTASLLLAWFVVFHRKQSVPQVLMGPSPTDEQTWPPPPQMPQTPLATVRLFPYGVSRRRLERAAQTLGVQVLLVNNVSEADAIIALHVNSRHEPTKLQEGIGRGIRAYKIESNRYTEIETALREIFRVSPAGASETQRPGV